MSTAKASYLGKIPTEVLQCILEELSQGELWNICALSRAFSGEVIVQMFRHVELGDCTLDQLASGTSLIASRPDLAQLIHALSLPGHIGFKHYSEDDDDYSDRIYQFQGQLSISLKSMSNLKSLFIVRPRNRNNMGQLYLDGKYFLGCTFRLKTFRNDRMVDIWAGADPNRDSLLPFLREQDQIQDFDPPVKYDFPRGSTIDNVLPKLSITTIVDEIEPSLLFIMAASRQLTRLKLQSRGGRSLRNDDIVKMLRILAPASKTLTHFYYEWNNLGLMDTKEASYVDSLRSIARGLPNLKFLRYGDSLGLDVRQVNPIYYVHID